MRAVLVEKCFLNPDWCWERRMFEARKYNWLKMCVSKMLKKNVRDGFRREWERRRFSLVLLSPVMCLLQNISLGSMIWQWCFPWKFKNRLRWKSLFLVWKTHIDISVTSRLQWTTWEPLCTHRKTQDSLIVTKNKTRTSPSSIQCIYVESPHSQSNLKPYRDDNRKCQIRGKKVEMLSVVLASGRHFSCEAALWFCL